MHVKVVIAFFGRILFWATVLAGYIPACKNYPVTSISISTVKPHVYELIVTDSNALTGNPQSS